MIGDLFAAALDGDKFCVIRKGRQDQLICHCVSEEWSATLAEVLNRAHDFGSWLSGNTVPWPAGEEPK
jgi:hypothetical protein